MKALLIVFAAINALCPAQAQELSLSAHERAWISQHPVVEYAIDPYWPIEYVEGGEHRGLSRDYLDHVQRTTGLRFVRVPSASFVQTAQRLASGELQVATAVSARLLTPPQQRQMLLSQAYFFAASVVVTRAAGTMLFDAQRLDGKTVAVRNGGGFDAYLQQHYSRVKLLPVESADAALAAVDEGMADAAIGLDTVLQPLMRSHYAGRLHLAGVLSDMPLVLTMAISPREPILVGIIDKALGSMTSRDTDEIYERWLPQIDAGPPSWGAVVRYYRGEIAMAALVLLLLIALSARAAAARRRAQSSEARMGAYLAMMTHEIRTPMSAMLATLELLARSRLGARQQEWVGLANSSAVNLLELLDDVLDISSLEARALSLDPQPTDVVQLAEGVAAIHRLAAEDKGVALNCACIGFAGGLVKVDPLRLRQVLSNLLSNAVKFTHEGDIVLRLELSGRAAAGAALLQVCVKDTGVGIALHQQTSLFQAFTQADPGTAGRYGGSGLGLSICKQLIELMGGDIRLHSVPGAGTEVLCRLPVSFSVAGTVQARPPPVASARPSIPRSLLVVEDHPVNRRAMGHQLQALGHAYLMAANGEQALEVLAQESDVGLVLLDCQLPGMDGYQLARRVRQLPGSAGRVPIIALSGAGDETHRQRCYASGMNDVLVKPLQLQQLDRVCRRFMAGMDSPLPSDSATQSLHELFMATCLEDLQGLAQVIASGDQTAVLAYAHRLHGAALLMGAQAFADAATELERKCAEAWDATALTTSMDRLYAALEHYSAEPASTSLP